MRQSGMEVEKAKSPKNKKKRWKETLGKEEKTRTPKEQGATPKRNMVQKIKDLKR
jgi:hypothetical protein